MKLIGQYGSVENLLEHADEISGALGRKIRDNVRQIRLSYDLATIRRDVPMDVDFDLLRREPEDVGNSPTYIAVWNSSRSLLVWEIPPPHLPSPEKFSFSCFRSSCTAVAVRLYRRGGERGVGRRCGACNHPLGRQRLRRGPYPAEVGEAVEAAVASGKSGVALYAVGAEAMSARLEAMAISAAEGRATMVRVPLDPARRKELMAILEPLFTSPAATVVSHDIKRDMILLRREGIDLIAPYFDTSLAHYVLQPEMRHRLADVAMQVLHYQTADYSDAPASRKTAVSLPTNCSRRASASRPTSAAA